MAYTLGSKSNGELIGVHSDMIAVCRRAIATTSQDFTIFDGIRTHDEQVEYVRTGVSKTLNSKHLQQPDGFGHAVDLVPYINGKLRWEMKPIIVIAGAVHDAATEYDTPLRWGAVWDTPFLQLDRDNLEDAVEEYIARRQAAGRKAFIDEPHFELVT